MNRDACGSNRGNVRPACVTGSTGSSARADESGLPVPRAIQRMKFRAMAFVRASAARLKASRTFDFFVALARATGRTARLPVAHIRGIAVVALACLFLSTVANAANAPTPPPPKEPAGTEMPAESGHALPQVKITVLRGTEHSDVEIELFEDDAPNTVANFIELCEKKFYDGLKFHDVIAGRWVQTGDPTGTGRGGPNYRFAHEINAEALGLDKIGVKEFAAKYKQTAPAGAEDMTLKELYEKQGFHFVPNLHSHPVVKGSVAMAYRVADTNGSQFIIALTDCPWLNGKQTVFGRVTSGFDALKLIQKGDVVEKIEILYKRDHPYHVKTLEEGKAER